MGLKGHGTMLKKSNKYISVFIPVFNGEQYLSECLESILNQELPDGYRLEVLVIDSGSTDKSLDILSVYNDRISLHTIPNSEFSHGGTRDKAARLAKGEFVLFLSQDATPTNYQWIKFMIEPFFLSDKIGCVFGRQIPRPNAAATIKREVATVFGSLGASDSIVLHRNKSYIDQSATNPLNSFYSDVNSAARRELLINDVPFQHVHYAEDQALATDMQNAGYTKAYAPAGSVWHSNEYTAKQYYMRKFDEYIGLQESVKIKLEPSLRSLTLGWIRPTLADWRFIRHDSEYKFKSKILWAIESPFYNIAEQAGKYSAAKNINNEKVRKNSSLEYQARKK